MYIEFGETVIRKKRKVFMYTKKHRVLHGKKVAIFQ